MYTRKPRGKLKTIVPSFVRFSIHIAYIEKYKPKAGKFFVFFLLFIFFLCQIFYHVSPFVSKTNEQTQNKPNRNGAHTTREKDYNISRILPLFKLKNVRRCHRILCAPDWETERWRVKWETCLVLASHLVVFENKTTKKWLFCALLKMMIIKYII